MFLTPDEVLILTGYQRHADQRRWLSDRGWAFEGNAAGRPVVSRAYAEQRLGVVSKEIMPDFSSLRKK